METFLRIHERLLRQLFQEDCNPWISNVTEDTPVLTRTGQPVTCGERQIPDTVLTLRFQPGPSPRFHPGPSAGNSFDPKEGRFFKASWGGPTKTADLGTSLRQIPHSNNICLLEDKIQKLRYVFVHNFLRKLCYGSEKWRWLNQWMI